MKKKLTDSNTICNYLYENMDVWNKNVKSKNYHLNENDSRLELESKIYRYMNEYDDNIHRLIQQEPNIERAANLK